MLSVAIYFVPRSLSLEDPAAVFEPPERVLIAAPLPSRLPVVPLRAGETVVLSGTTPIDSAVLPLGVNRIVIDPGHGGRDVGTVTPEGLYEKDLALDIGLRLKALLTGPGGYDVLMTRSRDASISLRDRASAANEARADLFISIHVNWFEPRTMRGVETYYVGSTQDPYLIELAGPENRESGYSLADARQLLDGIYLGLRTEQSQELAVAVQESLFRSLQFSSPGLRDRGVRSAPFIVLVATEMPAILAEVSCLSNRSEAERLATSAYRQEIAAALLEGVESYTMSLSQVGARGS